MASANRILYQEDYYCPPSDTEEEGNPNYYVLQNVTNIDPASSSNEGEGNNNTLSHIDTEMDTNCGLYTNNQGQLSHIPSTSDHDGTPSRPSSPIRTPSPTFSGMIPSPSISSSPSSNGPTIPIPRSLFHVHETDSDPDSEGDNASDNGSIEENPTNYRLMDNYERDEENINDFAEGWEWSNADIEGASYGPFTGSNELLIHPNSTAPIDYLKLFFPNSMFHRITTQTNLYANRKKQGK